MKIEVFVDDEDQPRHRLDPPGTFDLDTLGLGDGPHLLRIRATDEDGSVGVEEIPFTVRNGPGIVLVGLADGETIRGRVSLLVNAFASKPGDVFEPVRAETPAPIPTWAWVLFLAVVAWGMWYVAAESRIHRVTMGAPVAAGRATAVTDSATESASASASGIVLGEQVFGNKCAPCHQLSGTGVPNVFPPLKGDPVVLAVDPRDHVLIVLNGLAGKVIGGVSYASPMPAFADQLGDEEVAAVVNHERTSWGNQAPAVKPADVRMLRSGGAAANDTVRSSTDR